MREPMLRATIGRYVQSMSSIQPGTGFDVRKNPAYWDLVTAILIACHAYRRLRELREAERQLEFPSGSLGKTTSSDSATSEGDLFEEFASREQLCCAACGRNHLEFEAYEADPGDDQRVQVTFRCKDCKKMTRTSVSVQDLLRHE